MRKTFDDDSKELLSELEGALQVDLYTILLLPILHGVWHTKGGVNP